MSPSARILILPILLLLLLGLWQQARAQNPDVSAVRNGAVKPEETDEILVRISEAVRAMQPPPPAADYGSIGGIDKAAIVYDEMWAAGGVDMDVVESGGLYVVFELELPAGNHALRVHRSQDGGEVWQIWGTIEGSVSGSSYFNPSLHVAGPYVHIAYQRTSPGTDAVIEMARAHADELFTSFVFSTAMSEAGVSFDNPCLTSDEEVHGSGYHLYLVAEGDDGDGGDIWFNRSVNQTLNWETEYRIASLTNADRNYRQPKIAFGRNGQLHAVWYFDAGFTTPDWAIRYRRAVNWAGSGVADWEPVVYLTSNIDGFYEHSPVVAASHTTNRVAVAYGIFGGGPTIEDTRIWPSYDAGVTWNAADTTIVRGDVGPTQLRTLPDGEGFLYVGRQLDLDDQGIRLADEVTPLTWSNHLLFMDRSYPSDASVGTCRLAIADPNRDDQIAMIWLKDVLYTGPDTLFFDAEWRGEPGFPYAEAGFPMSLPAGVVSPPGICELDGDIESEIVFGDDNGYIRAYNHDGTVLSGWPKFVGKIPHDSPVAVGDLDGDGHYEVVCGNAYGIVYAFSDNGNLFPGWPVFLGHPDSVYVSIGRLTGSSNRQVVACIGDSLFLLSADGAVEPGFPLKAVGPFRSAAAIGDVDNDGTREIVVLQEHFMNVITGTGGSQAYRNFTTAGKTFKNSPTLADLDLNGDLEIVAPTEQGDVYVMTNDGDDYPGWPVTPGIFVQNSPITSVALANIRAGMEPELVFASRDIFVHAYYEDGGVLGGFPVVTTATAVQLGMPVLDPINDTSGDIVLPVWDFWAYAWDNFGNAIPGWPATLWGEPIVSAATGDIDADNSLEVVITTYTNPQLVIWDLGYPPRRADVIANRWWPMYGYNAQRQGCLFCESEDVVVPVGRKPVARSAIRFGAPVPNPVVAEGVRFAFELPGEAAVRLIIYDVTGRRVRELLRQEMDPGSYIFFWDGLTDAGLRAPAGNYYARLTVGAVEGTERLVRKVVLIR